MAFAFPLWSTTLRYFLSDPLAVASNLDLNSFTRQDSGNQGRSGVLKESDAKTTLYITRKTMLAEFET
jgi:hypothetical protein